MEVAPPGVWESILKIIMSIIALFTPLPEPQAEGALPMYLTAAAEELHFADPVTLAIVESEYGPPNVKGTLSGEDATRFADFTERHIGENVGFVVCEVELMAPRLMVRIEGGQFLISSPENNEAMLGFLSNGCP